MYAMHAMHAAHAAHAAHTAHACIIHMHAAPTKHSLSCIKSLPDTHNTYNLWADNSRQNSAASRPLDATQSEVSSGEGGEEEKQKRRGALLDSEASRPAVKTECSVRTSSTCSLLYIRRGWVDNRTLKTNHLIGLGKKEKGIKTLAVYLCEGPFIQKRKTDILRDVKIFCATSGTYIM